MPVCERCLRDARKVYDCEHTGERRYCSECYAETHYYLTEPGGS